MRRKPRPADPSPDFRTRLTPEQRRELEEAERRAATFHQVTISMGLGPEKAQKKGTGR
jgi:hypothetical protein